MKKKAPDWLSHKPIICADYEGHDTKAGDAKFISLGRSTWNSRDFSAKIWRKSYGTNRWSRQGEEIPFWRVLDLATLLVATINGRQSNLGEFIQDSNSEMELRNFLEENMEVLGPKMEELKEMMKQPSIELGTSGTPNIFSYATSELSQDAMFAWLIQWADPQNAKYDFSLNQVAQDFVRLLMKKSPSFEINSVDVGRQWKNIDIWAEINDNSFLVIEDKTGTSVHDNQLNRYKEIANEEYEGKRNDLCYAYVKTDNEPESILKQVRNCGYETIDRGQILNCLNKYSGDNPLLISYREHLQKIEDATLSFQKLPVKKWGWYAWQGFYMELEKQLEIDSWSYVANPAGGFLGIWWYFSDIEDGTMYLQIEQGKLCFKINYWGEEDRSTIRWNYHSKLIKTINNEFSEIVKPERFGTGTYMTIAIVRPEDLFGENEVNIEDVIDRLKKYQSIIDRCCKN